MNIEDLEEMIDVNPESTLYGIAAALPVFKQQGSGHIINIISTSGIKIFPLQGVRVQKTQCEPLPSYCARSLAGHTV